MDAEGKKVLKKRLERKLKTQQQKQKVSTEEHQKQEASKQERQARIQEEQELRKLRAKDRAIQFTKNHPQVPVVPEILTKNMARSLLLKHPDPPKQKKSSGVKTRSKNKA